VSASVIAPPGGGLDAQPGLVSIVCKVRTAGATAVGFTVEVVWQRGPDATEGGGEL